MLTVKQVREIMRKYGRGNNAHLNGIYVNKTVKEEIRTVKCYYIKGDQSSKAILQELKDLGAEVRLLEREDCVGTISVRAVIR
jgi:hypothetical protein